MCILYKYKFTVTAFFIWILATEHTFDQEFVTRLIAIMY